MISWLVALDFTNQAILLGAGLSISLLPFLMFISAFADERIDADLALHLGLDHHAAQIVSHLFSRGALLFDAATVVSLIFAVLGTLAVVTSLQEIYEKCSTSRTGDCGIFTESSSGFSRCAQSPVSWARSAAQSATAIFALLLGAFSRVYFSSTIIADDRTYGAIGAVFSLMTWLTAVGAVIILGAVAGGVWHERSSRRGGDRAQETIA